MDDAFAAVMGLTRGARHPLAGDLVAAARERILDAIICIKRDDGGAARHRANQMLEDAVTELANGRDLKDVQPFHVECADWGVEAPSRWRAHHEKSAEDVLAAFEEYEEEAWQGLLLAMLGEVAELGADYTIYTLTSTNHQTASSQIAHLLLHKHEWLTETGILSGSLGLD